MMRSLRSLLVLASCPAVIHAARLSLPSATRVYSNVTSTDSTPSKTNLPEITPVCCFVVQDDVNDGWWQETNTYTFVTEINLTSLTTYILNGTLVSVDTNVIPTTATVQSTTENGVDPLKLASNEAPTPSFSPNVLDGTATVTAGVTVQSPAAFYQYSTLRVITAPALSNRQGQTYCGTSTTISQKYGVYSFSNLNPFAQAYFGGLGYAGMAASPVTELVTTILTFPSPTPDLTTTFLATNFVEYNTDVAGESIDTNEFKPTGVVISLTTPLIYLPARGATGTTSTTGAFCLEDNDTEIYGYVPQTVIDLLVANPYYSSQYPGLESCLPGGPSIVMPGFCATFNVGTQHAGYDLTSSTTITLPTPDIHTSGGGGAASLLPTVKPPLSTIPPDPVAHPKSLPPTESQLLPPASVPALPESTVPPAGGPTPGGGRPSSNQGGGASPSPSSPFQTSIISGTPNIIITGPTTIPLSLLPASYFPPGPTPASNPTSPPNPNSPPNPANSHIPTPPPTPAALPFSTTTISGTPFLIIPSATAIPLPSSLFPGRLTVASGTTELIITGPTTIPVGSGGAGGLFTVSGVTVVSSGVTEVIVAGPTTVVWGGSGTSGGNGGSGGASGGSTGASGMASGSAGVGAKSAAAGGRMESATRGLWMGVGGWVAGWLVLGMGWRLG